MRKRGVRGRGVRKSERSEREGEGLRVVGESIDRQVGGKA